jgi:sugar/nucleoside kinase (ribokinase family)
LFVGFGVFPVVMRTMPFGINSAMAAVIMHANRWDAGIALMKDGNPDGWERLAADADLVSANREKITVCRDAAAKAKKEQHCAITVQAQ